MGGRTMFPEFKPKAFLTPDHPDAHVDFPGKLAQPEHMPTTVPCPKCDTWGGHNLELNAYPLRKDDTPENRHLFSHFRSLCSQCNGWGWVFPMDAKCIHEWTISRNLGNCYNEYSCTQCDRRMVVDSSD